MIISLKRGCLTLLILLTVYIVSCTIQIKVTLPSAIVLNAPATILRSIPESWVSEEDRERYEVVRFITEIAGILQEPTAEVPQEEVSREEAQIQEGVSHDGGGSADVIDPAGLTRIEVSDFFNDIVSDLDISQDRPRLTVLMTESRSGSSWLLSLLGFPSDTMHFFEPLNLEITARFKEHYSNLSPTEMRSLFQANKLSQICNCKLTDYYAGGMMGYMRNYPGRSHHGEGDNQLTIEEVISDCRSSAMRVAKTIRMYDITELEHLQDLECMDFKVVHLIRDPRAVMVSRMLTFHELYDGNKKLGPRVEGDMSHFSDGYLRNASRTLCQNHLHNLAHSSDAWLEGKYKRVRYEDLALDPVQSAQDIFEFSRQPWTKEVEQYVWEGSHTKTPGGLNCYDENNKTQADVITEGTCKVGCRACGGNGTHSCDRDKDEPIATNMTIETIAPYTCYHQENAAYGAADCQFNSIKLKCDGCMRLKVGYNYALAYSLTGLSFFLFSLMFVLKNIMKLFKKTALPPHPLPLTPPPVL
eukprot:sb/3463803/